MLQGFAFNRFADHLTSVAELSADDLELLTRMQYAIAHFGSHENVGRKGERRSNCALLLQGFLCWKDSSSGQITSIYVPGDVPDLHAAEALRLHSHLAALGPVVVASVPRAFFREIASASPTIDRALRRLGAAEMACLQNWIVNLGSRDSLARVAHLICEITCRLQAVGLAQGYRFASPFTQSDLAAACAITPVHANRIIQELRRRGALQWQSRTITVSDWDVLADLAGFEPDYLGLRETMSQPSAEFAVRPGAAMVASTN
jgi:CRP-like cAMP-binding protein